MHNKITRITVDFDPYDSFNPYIEVLRGKDSNKPRFYRITPMRLAWVQAITSKSGFVKTDRTSYKGRATWYHNIWKGFYNYKYESAFVTLEVMPDLHLKISITDKGREFLNEVLPEHLKDDPDYTGREILAEYELLEDALCNGWTLDPDDDGRMFITQSSIDDDGRLDVNAGDLGWSYNYYAIYSYVQDLVKKGCTIFDPYYFGETSLDDQRSI